jgi:hypothetical protein
MASLTIEISAVANCLCAVPPVANNGYLRCYLGRAGTAPLNRVTTIVVLEISGWGNLHLRFQASETALVSRMQSQTLYCCKSSSAGEGAAEAKIPYGSRAETAAIEKRSDCRLSKEKKL